jgi:hypothetical protein
MTSFVHIEYPRSHPGVERFESAVAAASQLRKNFDGAKGVAAVLLAAMVSALVVVADQLVETWVDGHLMAAWVLLWLVAFAALALLAPTAKRFAGGLVRTLDAWSRRVARERADDRLWEMAQQDPRVMADLRAALTRAASEMDADSDTETDTATRVVTQHEMPVSRASSEARHIWYM